jgi:hypothetical protein
MLQTFRSKPRIDGFDSTELYQCRIVVGDGSVNGVPFCALDYVVIEPVWIPGSIGFLSHPEQDESFVFQAGPLSLHFIVFESNSCFT